MNVHEIAVSARKAGRQLATLPAAEKNAVLEDFAKRIDRSAEDLLKANAVDVQNAEAEKIAKSMIDRLKLNATKIRQIVASVSQVASLSDPVGRVLRRTLLDDGLDLQQVTVPFGTVAAIVESRPDAVVQLISLALKSGNALIVKAGREANATVAVVERLVRESLVANKLSEHCINIIYGREAVAEILKMDKLVDLIVPRGSNDLIRYVQNNTRIPMIGHADGVCHIYIDSEADREMAIRIIVDAKTQAPSTCNAVETVLVHRDATDCVPALVDMLRRVGVKVRGCAETAKLSMGIDVITNEQEWATEYGDLTIAIKIVESIDEAMDHISRYASHHTDAIITRKAENATRFLNGVDSAGVYVNASTRFADGFRYGFGAEVGISTGKLPPRGPVGLDGLVTYKWVLRGEGHVVADYVGDNAKPFKHINM